MNVLKTTKRGLTAIFIIGLVLTSCSKDNDQATTEDLSEDTLEMKRSAEIDQIDNILGDLVIDAYEGQELSEMGKSSYTDGIPDCVTITLVAEQGFRELTLDFGSEGCVINGHLIQGKIIMDYTRDLQAQQVAINYNLVDFFFDEKAVIASRSILKELSNDDGNPQFTHNLSITVIWPNGLQASREGTRIRTWVEGFGSSIFSDNVFEVTGNWTATFVNGNTHTYEVIMPLRRAVICTYFVSGTFDVQHPNFGGLFDFGNGECDNQALFTFNNGTEMPITLN